MKRELAARISKTAASAALWCAVATVIGCVKNVPERAPLPSAATQQEQPRRRLTRVSYYGVHDGTRGGKTAAGEKFNPSGMTAAHRTLPFGTKVKMTNPTNGKSVIVRINDRGPYVRGREYDLSVAAAQALGIIKRGEAEVYAEVL